MPAPKKITLTTEELFALHEAMNAAAIGHARAELTGDDNWTEAAEALRDYGSAAVTEIGSAGKGLGRFARTLLVGSRKPQGRSRLTAAQVAALQRAGLI